MLYINSPAATSHAGLAIYDTMQFLHCDVATVCMGQAASMASFLLAAGAKGKRYALPHARVMIHQPLAGFRGQATDIEIHARRSCKARDTINELYAKHTGQPVDKIAHDTERDNFMSAEEAKDYGLIDEVLTGGKQRERRRRASAPRPCAAGIGSGRRRSRGRPAIRAGARGAAVRRGGRRRSPDPFRAAARRPARPTCRNGRSRARVEPSPRRLDDVVRAIAADGYGDRRSSGERDPVEPQRPAVRIRRDRQRHRRPPGGEHLERHRRRSSRPRPPRSRALPARAPSRASAPSSGAERGRCHAVLAEGRTKAGVAPEPRAAPPVVRRTAPRSDHRPGRRRGRWRTPGPRGASRRTRAFDRAGRAIRAADSGHCRATVVAGRRVEDLRWGELRPAGFGSVGGGDRRRAARRRAGWRSAGAGVHPSRACRCGFGGPPPACRYGGARGRRRDRSPPACRYGGARGTAAGPLATGVPVRGREGTPAGPLATGVPARGRGGTPAEPFTTGVPVRGRGRAASPITGVPARGRGRSPPGRSPADGVGAAGRPVRPALSRWGV